MCSPGPSFRDSNEGDWRESGWVLDRCGCGVGIGPLYRFAASEGDRTGSAQASVPRYCHYNSQTKGRHSLTVEDICPIISRVFLESIREISPKLGPVIGNKLSFGVWFPLWRETGWEGVCEPRDKLLEELRFETPYCHPTAVGAGIDVIERCTPIQKVCAARSSECTRLYI